uniref:Osteopetrosis-associated transmembrane protein 1 n=1 Tax=Culex tarsalis TaxID=7177 RepID=A0A1Q3FJN8_CULTA
MVWKISALYAAILVSFAIADELPPYNCDAVFKFEGQFEKIVALIPFHVYPVYTICTNVQFTKEYQTAMELYAKAAADPVCVQMNFKRSKVNLIDMMHDQLVALWTTANCQDCLDRANQTRDFFANFDALDKCLVKHLHSPCDPCADSYSSIQGQYEALVKDHKDTLCVDVEDRMNQTRHRWSAEFNCARNRQHSTTTFVVIASVFCSLPVVFYVVMYVVTRAREARERRREPLLDDSSHAEGRQDVPAGSGSGSESSSELVTGS